MSDPVDPRLLQQQLGQQVPQQQIHQQHQQPLPQHQLPNLQQHGNQHRPEGMDTSPQRHNLQNGQPHANSPGPLPPTDVLLAQCMNMMAQLLQQQQVLQQASLARQAPPNPEAILDSLASNIKEFRFDADAGVTFDAWFSRYDDLFEQDAARLNDAAKVRLLLRKLGIPEHERYISSILPREPKHFGFADTVAKLKALFSIKESVVSRRYKCLQVSKSPTEDHVGYACRVNKLCVGFDIGKLTEDQFKCLVYVCGLKSEADVELRTRLLTRIEENVNVSLEQLSEEAQRLLNLKHDSAMIEGPTTTVQAVKQGDKENRCSHCEEASDLQAPGNTKEKPEYPCWFCGALHYVRDCTFKDHKCADCDQVGHREGYCESAKKSRRSRKQRTDVNSNVVMINQCSVEKRRQYVLVGLDGAPICLQLDTASDITVIGRQTWINVGKPHLSPPTVKATTASGDPLQLAGEFSCSVTIGDHTHRELIRVSERQLQLLGSDLVDSFNLWAKPLNAFCCKISDSSISPEPARAFKRNDTVFVQAHAGISWRWATGVVIEYMGSAMYNVWIDDRRMLRVHISQLRGRNSQLPVGCLNNQPPLSPPYSTRPTRAPPQMKQATNRWAPSGHVPASRPKQSSEPELGASSLTSPKPTSSSPLSALIHYRGSRSGSDQEHQLPRSIQSRRVPRWFDPYHLY